MFRDNHDLGRRIDDGLRKIADDKRALDVLRAEIDMRWTNERVSRMVEEIKKTLKEKSINLEVEYLNAVNGKNIQFRFPAVAWLTYRIELTNPQDPASCNKTVGSVWEEIARVIAYLVSSYPPSRQ